MKEKKERINLSAPRAEIAILKQSGENISQLFSEFIKHYVRGLGANKSAERVAQEAEYKKNEAEIQRLIARNAALKTIWAAQEEQEREQQLAALTRAERAEEAVKALREQYLAGLDQEGLQNNARIWSQKVGVKPEELLRRAKP